MKKLKECGADDFDIAALGECVTPEATGSSSTDGGKHGG